MSDSQPGYRNQGRARTLMRLVGVIAMAAALTMIVLAVADFFSAFSSDEFGAQPTKFWLFFLALPFFLVGAFCLNAGFLGAGARYARARWRRRLAPPWATWVWVRRWRPVRSVARTPARMRSSATTAAAR